MRTVETRFGVIAYGELAPHLARKVLELEERVEDGKFATAALDDRLVLEFHRFICGDLMLETLAFAEGRLLSIHPFADFNGRLTRVWLREILRRLNLPPVPITAEQFANAELRASWIRDKGMYVLQFWSDAHRETPIDVFVAELFPFDEEYERALVKPLYGTIPVRVVSIPTLIRMKEVAGRPEDRIDIEYLRMRLEDDAKE